MNVDTHNDFIFQVHFVQIKTELTYRMVHTAIRNHYTMTVLLKIVNVYTTLRHTNMISVNKFLTGKGIPDSHDIFHFSKVIR